MTSTAKPQTTTMPFITCGMYAFTDELKQAWQTFFDLFRGLTHDTLDPTLRFDTDSATLCNDHLFIGHTCGYPLIKSLQHKLSPLCVPVFDAPGCNGIYNVSTFITSVNSEICSLSDSYLGIAAFNSQDSNSGINVFRHSVAPLAKGNPFFSSLIESGSHRQSLIEVAEGRADVAAIDSVSLALIGDAWPELADQVKTIGHSMKTCGLPFVISNSRLKTIDPKKLIAELNEVLNKLPDQHRQCLRLIEFAKVELNQYQSILDLEQQSVEMSYPRLI